MSKRETTAAFLKRQRAYLRDDARRRMEPFRRSGPAEISPRDYRRLVRLATVGARHQAALFGIATPLPDLPISHRRSA